MVAGDVRVSWDEENDGGLQEWAEVGQYRSTGAPLPFECGKGIDMGFIAKDNGGGDFKRVPPGVHIGRCFKLVDLGTQEVTWEGQSKLQDKITVYWELHGESEDGAPLTTDEGEPLTIFSTYTMSLGKKAKLRADLESWRGQPFTDDELKGFDISKLIDAYCMVNVVQTNKEGKTYSNVQSLTPLPSALRKSKPTGVLQNVVFNLDEFDEDVFDTFHEKLKEKINASVQRKGGGRYQMPAKNQGFAAMDDDIPF